MRILIASAVALLALAIGASAADIGSYKDLDARGRAQLAPVATAQSESWSALWGAALAGYSMSNTDFHARSYDDKGYGQHDTAGALSGLGGEGFDATVQIGGDYQLNGRAVIGAWLEYQFGGVESSARVGGVGRLEVEQNDSYGAFARAGLVSGNTLLYAAGGYVWSEADAKLSLGDETLKRTFDFSGPAAELGVEHRFSPHVRGKLSARYTWFDEETLARGYDDATGDGYKLDAEPGAFSVKAGVVISTGSLF